MRNIKLKRQTIRKWQKENPEQFRAIKKRYYEKHKEEILTKKKAKYHQSKNYYEQKVI